jgi:hypothetical protein
MRPLQRELTTSDNGTRSSSAIATSDSQSELHIDPRP